jgi:hypothetical protein
MGKIKAKTGDITAWAGEDTFLDKMDKAGYLTDFHEVDHDKMATDRKWATKDGTLIDYDDLTDDHLSRIIGIFNEGKFRNREQHFRGLTEEYFARISTAGEILFGRSKV